MTVLDRETMLYKVRELLLAKRDRFEEYLNVLERQETSITDGDLEALEYQVGLEREILEDIRSVHRVLTPLRELVGDEDPASADLAPLEASLHEFETKVTRQHDQNRSLLSRRTTELAEQIDGLQVPRFARNVYGRTTGSANLVDVTL